MNEIFSICFSIYILSGLISLCYTSLKDDDKYMIFFTVVPIINTLYSLHSIVKSIKNLDLNDIIKHFNI